MSKFFDGQSFSIWFFVSGALIILYGKYGVFDEKVLYVDKLRLASLIALTSLILLTLIKNIVFIDPIGLSNKLPTWIKLSKPYKRNKWVAVILGSEARKFDLPINVKNFRKLYSRVRVVDPGDGRWRAGFVFNTTRGQNEYIFHAYQDTGQTAFRSRIVERVPGIKEVKDVNKQIGVENPHNFEFWVEPEEKELAFYIEGVLVGSYKVPLDKISNIQIAAWSDEKPIRILFENIEALI